MILWVMTRGGWLIDKGLLLSGDVRVVVVVVRCRNEVSNY